MCSTINMENKVFQLIQGNKKTKYLLITNPKHMWVEDYAQSDMKFDNNHAQVFKLNVYVAKELCTHPCPIRTK